MDISVLLATYRRDEALRSTLESFTRLELGRLSCEFLVIDNAGEGSTREVIHTFRGCYDVKYLVERTPGKNSALNTGVSEAAGSLLVFTDDDVIAAPDWLEQTWEGAARWPAQCVFGGRILPCWPSSGPMLPLPAHDPLLQGAFTIADWPFPEGPMAAIQVWGPNMSVRASLFRDGWRFNTGVGPRGTDYVMGSETDLTVRLERAGYGAVYLPKSLVWHQIRAEQLRSDWLYKRAFRNGRGLAVHARCFPSAPRLLGVPRFLWRRLGETGLKRLIATVSCDRPAALRFGMLYWRWRGYLYQCRVTARHSAAGVATRNRPST